MSAISAAAVSFRTLADGSARVTIDFEPQDVDAAFALLGKPGQPIAVAALRTGHAAIPASKVGPLCLEAVRYCEMPEFQEWRKSLGDNNPTAEGAKTAILWECQIQSRKELDTNTAAGVEFVKRVRLPFMAWMRAKG